MERRDWTRNELIIAYNLYCKTPFGRIHIRNPQIIELAHALGRTPSALSWKLANLARLDPALQRRNIAGASHGNKLEEEVWQEFSEDWNNLAYESERLISGLLHKPLMVSDEENFPPGKTRDTLVRVRVNQGFFRAAVLAAYGCRCCITGLGIVDLLSAGHIVPWSANEQNRTNPCNGLCLNSLHDRAFDRGLMTITADYRVRFSPVLRAPKDKALAALLLPYEGIEMSLPNRFRPDPAFLKHHEEHIFRSVA